MRLLILLLALVLPSQQVLAESPRLLFDQGHRQAFVIEKEGPLQLGNLANTFQQQGWHVGMTTDELTAASLAQVDALIISGAFAPLSSSEIEAVLQYLTQGGRLAVMIHIGQPLTQLLHALGVEYGTMVINEDQNQADGKTINFSVTDLMQHPLTEGLQQFSIYGGWPLRPFTEAGTAIANSSPESWVDMNRDKKFSEGDLISPFAVLVTGAYGRGSFTVFADDAIFQNQFLRNGNLELAKNLAQWLKVGPGKQIEI